MIKEIKVAEDRIGAVIGNRGNTKKDIERYTNTALEIGDVVTISGEALDVLTAENIVRAIGRGFAPHRALDLLDENYTLVVLPLNPKSATRIKARVIGTKGKTRVRIQKLTRTSLCIYGKTISIIGTYHRADLARDAVQKLIEGAPHTAVYEFLERRIAKAATTTT